MPQIHGRSDHAQDAIGSPVAQDSPPALEFAAAVRLYQRPLREALIASWDVAAADQQAASAFLRLARAGRPIDLPSLLAAVVPATAEGSSAERERRRVAVSETEAAFVADVLSRWDASTDRPHRWAIQATAIIVGAGAALLSIALLLGDPWATPTDGANAREAPMDVSRTNSETLDGDHPSVQSAQHVEALHGHVGRLVPVAAGAREPSELPELPELLESPELSNSSDGEDASASVHVVVMEGLDESFSVATSESASAMSSKLPWSVDDSHCLSSTNKSPRDNASMSDNASASENVSASGSFLTGSFVKADSPFAPGVWDRDLLAGPAVDGGAPKSDPLPALEAKRVEDAPYPLQLVATKDAEWRGEAPDVFQEVLLELESGSIELRSPEGHFSIDGPATVYFELPSRVTVQLGSLEAELTDSLEIDTPFGLAAADGAVGVRSSVEGMVVRSQRGSVEMRSPSGAVRLVSRSHACALTPDGRFYDWHVVLEASRDRRRLVINGQPLKLSARQFDKRALAVLLEALTAIQGQAEGEGRFELAGMLRTNGKLHVYDKVSQIPAAQGEATRQFQAALAAIKSGADPLADGGVDGAMGEAKALLRPRPWIPELGALGIPVAFRAAGPMRANPFSGAPRIQKLPPTLLVSQLMQLPSVELYRSNEAGMRMGRTLERMANLSPVSGPPPREPVFEILPTRPDLQGLPYLRGGACRLPSAQQNSMAMVSRLSRSMGPAFVTAAMQSVASPAAVPALTQVLESKSHTERVALTSMLRSVANEEAVEKLARRAIFDVSPQVRDMAVAALMDFRDEARPHLLGGLRYPWAPAAMHAAEALVRLQDKASVPQLVSMLDAPSPEAPVLTEGQWAMPQLVKLNHMTNCALCHAPSTSATDMMRTPVPMPTRSMRLTPVRMYYGPTVNRVDDDTPQGFIRADITYLRQDFSVTTATKAFRPWPDEQRFDFLVRSISLNLSDVQAAQRRAAGNHLPYRRAVHFALQNLTGEPLPISASGGEWRAKID